MRLVVLSPGLNVDHPKWSLGQSLKPLLLDHKCSKTVKFESLYSKTYALSCKCAHGDNRHQSVNVKFIGERVVSTRRTFSQENKERLVWCTRGGEESKPTLINFSSWNKHAWLHIEKGEFLNTFGALPCVNPTSPSSPCAAPATDWLTAAGPPPAAWMGGCSSRVTGSISVLPLQTQRKPHRGWVGMMDGRRYGLMDGWMNKWMEGWRQLRNRWRNKTHGAEAGAGNLKWKPEIESWPVDKLSLHLSQ